LSASGTFALALPPSLSRHTTLIVPLVSSRAIRTSASVICPLFRSASLKSSSLTISRRSTLRNNCPSRASTTGTPSTSRSARWLREVTKATHQLKKISTAASSRPPPSEVSSPISEFCTDVPSSTTSSMSKGVNWPMVRLPDRRTSTSSTT